MKNCFCFFPFLSLSWADANAQLNESDTLKFQLRTNLTGNYQQGNVNILTIRSKIDFSFSPKKTLLLNRKTTAFTRSFHQRKRTMIFSAGIIFITNRRKEFTLLPSHISLPITEERLIQGCLQEQA